VMRVRSLDLHVLHLKRVCHGQTACQIRQMPPRVRKSVQFYMAPLRPAPLDGPAETQIQPSAGTLRTRKVRFSITLPARSRVIGIS
jgi:hypothetical protein